MPRWLLNVLGALLTLGGLAIVGVDVYTTSMAGASAHWLNVGIGVVLAWLGAYIMVPAWTKSAVENAADAADHFIRLPGGRRETDPPVCLPVQPDAPAASVAVAETKLGPGNVPPLKPDPVAPKPPTGIHLP